MTILMHESLTARVRQVARPRRPAVGVEPQLAARLPQLLDASAAVKVVMGP